MELGIKDDALYKFGKRTVIGNWIAGFEQS